MIIYYHTYVSLSAHYGCLAHVCEHHVSDNFNKDRSSKQHLNDKKSQLTKITFHTSGRNHHTVIRMYCFVKATSLQYVQTVKLPKNIIKGIKVTKVLSGC
jgi:hypothetical protein